DAGDGDNLLVGDGVDAKFAGELGDDLGAFEHGEVHAEALVSAAAEGEIGVAVGEGRGGVQEAGRVEAVGVGPEILVALGEISGDQNAGAFGDGVAVDVAGFVGDTGHVPDGRVEAHGFLEDGACPGEVGDVGEFG